MMRLGLFITPATFKRLIKNNLKGMSSGDDMIVRGKSIDEHIERLGLVFQGLCETNFNLSGNVTKVQFRYGCR